jgi:predicted N-acetyltransferase YhbS
MADKDQDEMLREAARARGFRLVKSRRRKAGGDFGKYGLVDLKSGRECFGFEGDGLTGTADEVLTYLRGGEVASWKRSLLGVVGEETGGKGSKSKPAKVAAPPPAEQAEPKAKASPRKRPSTSLGTSGTGGGASTDEKRKRPAKAVPAEVAIRPATRRDAASIARLIGTEPSLLAERLAAAIRGDDVPLVAEQDGIVGIVAWATVATLQQGPVGRIALLHVAERSRRQGLGSRLIKEAQRQLGEAGVSRIELLLDIELDAPAGFLRKTGFQRSANGYGKMIG